MSRVKTRRSPGEVVNKHARAIESRTSTTPPSDEIQRALEQVFAPLGPEVMKAVLAFEQIPGAGMSGMSDITERVWYQKATTLLSHALMPEFDLACKSAQSTIFEQQVQKQSGPSFNGLLVNAQIARVTTMRRIVEHLLKGSATTPPTPRANHGVRTTAKTVIVSPSQEIPLSIFAPAENPVAAFQARERALIALAAKVPERILPLAGFRQIVDRRLQFGRGEEFLDKLHVSIRKAHRRTRTADPLQVDQLLLTMAQHWMNPDYPLWMMREPAATKVLNVVFKLDGDLTEAFRERRRKHFPGPSAYFILDVSVEKNDDLRQIKAYKLSGNETIGL